MKKNKLIIGGALALLAFYFLNNMRKKKEVSELKAGADKSIAISSCEQEWIDKVGSVSRFTSAEASEQSKSSYIANCLKQ